MSYVPPWAMRCTPLLIVVHHWYLQWLSGLSEKWPLPAVDGVREQQVALTDNTSGLYTDRWVRLEGDITRCARFR